MWQIDYAVRNSGSFRPLVDMESTALSDLAAIASEFALPTLSSWLRFSTDEGIFCQTYDQNFDEACTELKRFYEATSA